MKKLHLFLLIINSLFAFAQDANPEKQISKDSIYLTVDYAPEFPGGISKFRQKFAQNFVPNAITEKGTVTCNATFVLSENGEMEKIEAQGSSKSFNQETVRTLRSMKKIKWTPAKIKTTPVKYLFRLPLTMRFE